MAAKLKTGDEVIVVAGKDKGKKGKITKMLRDDNKVVVSGVNVATKHQKPAMGETGGIKKIEMPIQISNVAVVDPKDGTATRVGFKDVKGKKVRFAKKSGEELK